MPSINKINETLKKAPKGIGFAYSKEAKSADKAFNKLSKEYGDWVVIYAQEIYPTIIAPFQKARDKIKSIISSIGKSISESKIGKAFANQWASISGQPVMVWFEALIQAIRKSIVAIGAFIAALATLAALLVKNAFSVAKLGDEIDKGSQKLNMSVSQYQKWKLAMELCGSSIEEMREGYNQMSGKISQSINGTESSAKAFETLGVNLKDVNGNLRSTGDIFEDTITSLQSIENNTERTALAYQLFGESTSKLNPLLNQQAGYLQMVERTQRALNSTMSEEMVAASASLQDSISLMKSAWQGLGNSLAQGIIPIIQKVVVWITVAIAKVNIFIRSIFGLGQAKDSAKQTQKAAQSMGAYADSIESAAGAAKDLKKQTMGFDEMNILQDNSSSGSSAGTGAGASVDTSGLGNGLDVNSLLPENALEDIENFQKEMDKISGKVAFWVSVLATLGGAFLLVFGAIKLNIPMMLAGVALCGLGISIAESNGDVSKQIDDIVNKVGPWVAGLGPIIGAIGAVIGFLTGNIPLFIAGIGLAGIGIAAGVSSGAYADWGAKIVEVLAPVGKAIANVFTTWFKMLDDFFSPIGNWIYQNVIAPIVNFVLAAHDKVVEIITAIVTSIYNFFSPIVKWFSDLLQSIKNTVKSVIDNIWIIIKGLYITFTTMWAGIFSWIDKTILQPVRNAVESAWGKLTQGAAKAWQGVKNVFSSVAGFFRNTFSAAWTAVKNVFSTGGKIFEGIKEGISSVFKSVVNGLIDGINNVVAVPFDGINWALSKIRNIKIFNLRPFKDLGSISVPVIPHLATGGLINGATIAEIGENGREAVLPLENNTQWMDKLADKVAERNSGAPTKLILQVDGKVLGQVTIDNINNITRLRGSLPLVFG